MTGNSTPPSFEKIAMEVVEEVLELPSGERRSAIESREDIPDEARELALQLLGSDGNAIRTGAAGDALPADETAPPALPGYNLLRMLGRGGMGAVWLAERVALDFEHKVAIKVIKPGVMLDTLTERFRRERQILAQLNHPHIAILHDGGETPQGEPFIVMEYVDGVILRDWLEGDDVSLDRKLALFLQVADAVEFAHQNLIIHRDLTPGNVLVKEDDQAKLIDFGIASLQVDEAEGTGGSTFSGLSLTPGFAAPERRQGLSSNTLTDIYSLGRILHLMIGKSGEAELLAIAAKASAEAPEDRYAGVGEMIEDIKRFSSGEPVVAYSNSRRYRFQKFLSREKALVGVVGAALTGLLIAFAATIYSYNEAENSRTVAEQRFSDLRSLANYQLFDLYEELDSVVGNTAARAELAEQSQGYLVELAAGRLNDPELQLETAFGFLRLAQIQGVPAGPQLGNREAAVENLDRADALLEGLQAGGMDTALTGLGLSKAFRSRSLLHGANKPEEAVKVAAEAQELFDQVAEADRDWQYYLAQRELRISQLEIADLAVDREGLLLHTGLMESDIETWPEDKRDGFEARLDKARIEYFRAIAEHNLGNLPGYQQGAVLFNSAEQLFAQLDADYPNDPHMLYWRIWNAYIGYANAATIEDYEPADRFLQQARSSVERLRSIEERDNSLVVLSDNLLEAQAEFYSYQGRHSEALRAMDEMIERVISRDERNLDEDEPSRDMAYSRAILGSIHRRAGNRKEACANFAEAAKRFAVLRSSNQLPSYIEQLEPGLKANLAKCQAGAPVTSMGELLDPFR